MTDLVNHPPHYTAGGIECIDAIEAAVSGLQPFEGYCVGNAIKYLWRWKHKGGQQDLEKAVWYIRRISSEKEAQKPAELAQPSFLDAYDQIELHAYETGGFDRG